MMAAYVTFTYNSSGFSCRRRRFLPWAKPEQPGEYYRNGHGRQAADDKRDNERGPFSLPEKNPAAKARRKESYASGNRNHQQSTQSFEKTYCSFPKGVRIAASLVPERRLIAGDRRAFGSRRELATALPAVVRADCE
jgi:hypothetical protein